MTDTKINCLSLNPLLGYLQYYFTKEEIMTEQEAFEAAKQTILEQRPDADDFYLDEADFENGNWVIMIGYLRALGRFRYRKGGK